MQPPDGCVSLQQAAREIGVGSRRLFQLLREQHVLGHDNIPYSHYTTRGHFVVRYGDWWHPEKGRQTYARTFVTRRGLTWLRDLVHRAQARQPEGTLA